MAQCLTPVKVRQDLEVPCKKCLLCRSNRTRIDYARWILEARYWPQRLTSVTLTEVDQALVRTPQGYPTLDKRRAQAFLDRVRKSWQRERKKGISPGYVAPFPEEYRQKVLDGWIRYFLRAEYGDASFRPHYHLLIAGPSPRWWNINAGHLWPYGRSHVTPIGTGETTQFAYVTGHTLKKSLPLSEVKLRGRQAPFNLSSRSPPIGGMRLQNIERIHQDPQLARERELTGDVRPIWRKDGIVYPLDRWQIKKLREAFDIPQLARDRPPRQEMSDQDKQKREARAKHLKQLFEEMQKSPPKRARI